MAWEQILGAGIDATSQLISDIFGFVNTDNTNKVNKKIADKNNQTSIQIAQDNLDFEKQKFGYDQYLNENQNQIQARDMSKAGLNPLAGNSANLSTVSVGSGSLPSLSTPSMVPYQPSSNTNFAGALGRIVDKNLQDDMINATKNNLREQINSSETIAKLNNEEKRLSLISQLISVGASVEDIKNITGKDVSKETIERVANKTEAETSNLNSSARSNNANAETSERTLPYTLDSLDYESQQNDRKNELSEITKLPYDLIQGDSVARKVAGVSHVLADSIIQGSEAVATRRENKAIKKAEKAEAKAELKALKEYNKRCNEYIKKHYIDARNMGNLNIYNHYKAILEAYFRHGSEGYKFLPKNVQKVVSSSEYSTIISSRIKSK